MNKGQLVFDLGKVENFDPNDFFISESNQATMGIVINLNIDNKFGIFLIIQANFIVRTHISYIIRQYSRI